MFVCPLPSDMRSAFGTKFSRSDRALLTLGPTRREPQSPAELQPFSRPGFGSSVWQALLGATPGVTPRPRPDRGALGNLSEKRKVRPGRPASQARLAARTRHVFRRATSASCGAHPARLPACKRHVFWRATGASCGAHPARLSGVQSAPSGAHRRAQGRAI